MNVLKEEGKRINKHEGRMHLQRREIEEEEHEKKER